MEIEDSNPDLAALGDEPPRESADGPEAPASTTTVSGAGEVRPAVTGPAASNVYEDRTTVQPAVLTEMQNGLRDPEGNPIEPRELDGLPAALPGSREAPTVDSPEHRENLGEIADQTVDPATLPETEEQYAAVPDPDQVPGNPLGAPVPADYMAPNSDPAADLPPVSQPAVQGEQPEGVPVTQAPLGAPVPPGDEHEATGEPSAPEGAEVTGVEDSPSGDTAVQEGSLGPSGDGLDANPEPAATEVEQPEPAGDSWPDDSNHEG